MGKVIDLHVYGDIVVSRKSTVVEKYPDRALVSLEFVSHLGCNHDARMLGQDMIDLGDNEQGQRVQYRVIGWSSRNRCLILIRVAPDSVE